MENMHTDLQELRVEDKKQTNNSKIIKTVNYTAIKGELNATLMIIP